MEVLDFVEVRNFELPVIPEEYFSYNFVNVIYFNPDIKEPFEDINNVFYIGKLSQIDWVKKKLSTRKATIYTHSLLGADMELETGNTLTYNPVWAEDIFNPEFKTSSKIGLDGALNVLEIRPDPAHERKLFQNIRKLIKKIPVAVYTAGDAYPCGAHIHFSNPIENFDTYAGDEFRNAVIDLMDELAVDIIKYGSARGDYRNLSAYRKQPHGFEYRSLPSIILTKPEITKKVLQYAGMVQHIAMKKTFNYITEDNLPKLYKLKDEIINMIYNLTKEPYIDVRYNWFKIKGAIKYSSRTLKISEHDFFPYTIRNEFHRQYQTVVELFVYGLSASRGKECWTNSPIVEKLLYLHFPDHEVKLHQISGKYIAIGLSRTIRENKEALRNFLTDLLNLFKYDLD